MNFVSKNNIYRQIGLALTCVTLSSSAMHSDTMKPPMSWWNNFWARATVPSSDQGFSKKQLAIGAGTIGVGLAGFFLWKRVTMQPKLYSPIIEEQEEIKSVFNPALDLASHCRILSHIQNEEKRQKLKNAFQNDVVDKNFPHNTNAWSDFVAVKHTLYNKQQREAILNIVRESKGKDRPIELSVSIPETPSVGDDFIDLGIVACNGQITKIYKDSLTKQGEKRFARRGYNSFNQETLSLLNGVLKEFDRYNVERNIAK
jgi:nitrogen regulatory protein PII-like uncharacterized protein